MIEQFRPKDVESLVKEINDAYGKHIVTIEDKRIGFMVHIGDYTLKRICSSIRLRHYLEGMKYGIELMKKGLQLLIGQRNICP